MRFILLVAIIFISSCSHQKISRSQVKPESLLTSNVEDVTFSIAGRGALDSMFKWVLNDRPSQAVLYCTSGDSLCVGAEKILSSFSVPYNMVVTTDNQSSVSLKYSRILTKNCKRGIGCAMSANFIGAITNQEDFTEDRKSVV